MLYQDTCTGVVLCVAGIKSGFAPTASLGAGGRVQIGGHAACANGTVAELRVTITQAGTGAVAEGTTRIACSGEESPWEIQAATNGRNGFTAGPVTACGLLEVDGEDDPPDAFQWCRDGIDLVEP
jgi:hypothetical protein